MINPLTLSPNTQEDTQAGDRISMDEERAQTLFARQQATSVVVGTVSGYLQSVVDASEAGMNHQDPETAQAHRETYDTYRRLQRTHGVGNVQASRCPIKGTKVASRKVTAAEVLASLPEETQKTLEQRRLGLDTFIDEVVEETWVKEGRLLTQAEIEAQALALKIAKPESEMDPSNPRITVENYIRNFGPKK